MAFWLFRLSAIGERRDAERGQALVRELDVDLLGPACRRMSTFLTMGTFSRLALDVLGDVGQLRLPDAVTLDGVQQAEYTSPYSSLKIGPIDAVGQLELEVAELLARLVPGFALVACARCRPSR